MCLSECPDVTLTSVHWSGIRKRSLPIPLNNYARTKRKMLAQSKGGKPEKTNQPGKQVLSPLHRERDGGRLEEGGERAGEREGGEGGRERESFDSPVGFFSQSQLSVQTYSHAVTVRPRVQSHA